MTLGLRYQLGAAAEQLRKIAGYLEDLVPGEDSDRPGHEQLQYITRHRTFAEASTAQAQQKKARRQVKTKAAAKTHHVSGRGR
jgi:hypothetical protein